MFRIDNVKAAGSPDAVPVVGTPGYFTVGDPNTDTPATPVDSWWLNMVQEEILAVLTAASISPDKTDNGQLLDAINALIGGGGGGGSVQAPTGFIYGCLPSVISATQVQIPVGTVRADADDLNIVVASPITVAITSSGVNGLKAGSVEAANTLYDLYLIADSNAVNNPAGLLVPQGVGFAYPTGYDRKRKLPFNAVNNASSDFIKMSHTGGWPQHPAYIFTEINETYRSFAGSTIGGDTRVLSGGTAGTFTAVSLANFVPAGAATALLKFSDSNSGDPAQAHIRPTGSSIAQGHFADAVVTGCQVRNLDISAAASIDYFVQQGALHLDVLGFTL